MNPDMPPFWAVYVSVADAEATLTQAAAAGGTVLMGPMTVFDAGTMGVIQDLVGSVISIWQPDQHIGAQLVNQPGTFTWNELATTDLAAARQFYQAVFGWGVDEHGTSENGTSENGAIFTVAGNVTCGAHKAGPNEYPAWSVWFAVEDCDKSAAMATELGGSILMPPSDMDFGRGSVIADPHGAVFRHRRHEGRGLVTRAAGAPARYDAPAAATKARPPWGT